MGKSYEEVLSIKRKYEKKILELGNVHGVSIGIADDISKDPAIYIHSSKNLDKSTIQNNMKNEDVNIKIVIDEPPKQIYNSTRYDPLQGGCLITSWLDGLMVSYGTMGCFAIDLESKKIVGVSNSHALPHVGGDVYQFKQDVCNVIGRTIRKTDLKSQQTADAGITSINRNVDLDQIDLGPIKGVHTVTFEDLQNGPYYVRKVGASSGITNGRIVNINYSGNAIGWNWFYDQIKIVSTDNKIHFTKDGDSGSALINNDSEIVGLVWGGGRFSGDGNASPIKSVTDALNIEILTVGKDKPETESNYKQLLPILNNSTYGRYLISLYKHYEADLKHLVHEDAKLFALWKTIPQTELHDIIISISSNENYIIPKLIKNHEVTNLVNTLGDRMVNLSNKPIKEFIIELKEILLYSTGKSWKQTLEYINKKRLTD